MIRIKNITCEHCTAPLAVAVQNPRFSWVLESDRNQTYQNAYRIVVLDSTASPKSIGMCFQKMDGYCEFHDAGRTGANDFR